MIDDTSTPSAALSGPVARHLEHFRGGTPRVLAPGLDAAGQDELRELLGAGTVFADDTGDAGEIDVVLDYRAGAEEKILGFEALWPRIAAGGIYLCATRDPEATRLLRAFFADLLDDLHAFHKRGPKPEAFRESAYTHSVDSVHFYPRWIAIEQRSRARPDMVYSGEPQF